MSRLIRIAAIASAVVWTGLSAYGPLRLDAAVAQSDRSQTVHLRLQSFALNLNPLKMADVESRRIGTLLYTGLVAVDQDGAVHPRIAQSWRQPQPGTWSFQLTDGITFSNGQPVEAEDVVASLCASLQPQSPWAWALASIVHKPSSDGKSVECTGLSSAGRTVTIKETKPVHWLLDALSGPAGWIVPRVSDGEQTFGVMLGAGPYAVEEIRADDRVVLRARRGGSAVDPGSAGVIFHYVNDPAIAARMFAQGEFDVLDVDSPLLVDLLFDGKVPNLTMRYSGHFEVALSDRIRLVIVNEKRLIQRGFSKEQVRAFERQYSTSIQRARIADLSKGIGIPMSTPVPIEAGPANVESNNKGKNLALPSASLSLITESDPFSDLIAASLPKRVGNVRISYRGVDKGILIDSLLKGDYDLASIILEATIHTPKFWTAFFTKGSGRRRDFSRRPPTPPYVRFRIRRFMK